MLKLFNLDRLWNEIREESLHNIDQSLSTGKAQDSACVEEYLKNYTKRKYVIPTANCTDALTIILRRYPPGSEILVPCYSFIATATSILLAGLKPVFVDIDENYHLDLNKVEVNECTVGMILVSLFGNPADYYKYEEFCVTHNIHLIEDAAQSFGSEYKKLSGAAGTVSAYSFSPSKPCPVLGSGGAILTDDEDLAHYYRKSRLHGKSKNSDLTFNLGTNSMMGTAEAQQLMVSFKYKHQWEQRRAQIAAYYDDNIRAELPPRQGIHNWHKYVIQSDAELPFARHYKNLIVDEPIFNDKGDYPNARKLQKRCYTLPTCPHMTDTEVEQVVNYANI